MSITRLTACTLIGLAAFTLAGCDTTKAPAGAGGDPVAQENYPKVVLDEPLRGWVTINSPVVTRGDVLKVSTPVRLMSDIGQASRVQYRYIWLNESGAPLRSQPEWRYTVLEPRIQQFLTGNSLDRAADWRLEIRSAR